MMLNSDLSDGTTSFSYKTSEGLVIMDPAGKVLYANSFAKEILGYSDEEMEGKFCFETCQGYDLSGNRCCFSGCAVFEMARRNELVQNFDIQLVNRKGKKIWLNVTTLFEANCTYNVESKIIHIFRPTDSPVGRESYLSQSPSIIPGASLNKSERNSGTFQKGSQVVAIARKFHLSPRETEVFECLTQGHGSQEIAEMFELSPTTIRTHVQRILKKMQVHSMLEAVALALGERA